ncbi:DUF58 domain-containing protein [Haliangium sp.]|uniref:DUF58 domain-containing protein n=1 Tax=Haliangium sp. TaxID=2663208 RepID=UPI003D11C20A
MTPDPLLPTPGSAALAPRSGSGLLRWLRAWTRPPRRLRFTREGRYFVAISVGIGLAAINTGNNLLYLLLGWLLSVIIASGVLSELSLRHLRIRRRPPPRIFAGQPFLMEISVENIKRSLASYSIEVEDLVTGVVLDKKCYFLKVPSGKTQRTSYRHGFARRGLYRFTGFRIGTKFPFALFRKSRDIEDPTTVVVYPRVYPIAVLAPRARHVGGEVARQPGRRGEFFGLREYREGDDRRDIHWPSTARGGRPLVREYEEESQKQAAVFLDNALPPGAMEASEKRRRERERQAKKQNKDEPNPDVAAPPLSGEYQVEGLLGRAPTAPPMDPEFEPPIDRDDPVEAMERAISAAASMAAAYLSRGYAVELVARGRRVPMAAGPPQLTRILDALARLSTTTDDTAFTALPAARIESILFYPKLAGDQRGRPGDAAHVFPVD